MTDYRPEPGVDYPHDQLDREFRAIQVAMDNRLKSETAFTFFPFKAGMVKFTGAGVSDPVIDGAAYNISGVTRTGLGTYSIQFDIISILGVNIVAEIYPVITFFIDDLLESYQVALTDGDSSGGTVEITVFELGVSGQNIIRVPHDLTSADEIWFTATLNIVDPEADTVPQAFAAIARDL